MSSLLPLLTILVLALPLTVVGKEKRKINKDVIYDDKFQFEYELDKEADKTPEFALLNFYTTCRTPFKEAKKLIGEFLTEKAWPNVYWKNTQDARPTLYIFNKNKKFVHRDEVHDKTAEEIKELLNSYGFYAPPDTEDNKAENEKSEL